MRQGIDSLSDCNAVRQPYEFNIANLLERRQISCGSVLDRLWIAKK